MAKSQWVLLLLTEILSAISVIVLIVSFSTDSWVVSEAKYEDETVVVVRDSQISYGLFNGRLTRQLTETKLEFDLAIVCAYSTNKCYYSCQKTSSERKDELEALLNGQTFKKCDPIQGRSSANIKGFNEQVKQLLDDTATSENSFLSAGLWLTTVIFLALSCIFALVSGFFSMLNIFWRPFRTLTSTFGLYIWNLIAAIICLLTMIFWLSLYFIFITKNIAITDTLQVEDGFYSKGLSSLGFSFWIIIISICCHIANIGVVYYRNYKLQQEPKTPVIKLKKNDSNQPDFY